MPYHHIAAPRKGARLCLARYRQRNRLLIETRTRPTANRSTGLRGHRRSHNRFLTTRRSSQARPEMDKHTKLTLIVVLLGLLVFGQALGVAAQTEPPNPTQEAAAALAPSASAPRVHLNPQGDITVRWQGPSSSQCQLLFGPSPDQLTGTAESTRRMSRSGLHTFKVPVSPDQPFLYFAFTCAGTRHDLDGVPFKFAEAPAAEAIPSEVGSGLPQRGESQGEVTAPIQVELPRNTAISDFQFVSGEPSDEVEIARFLAELNSPLAAASLEPEEGLSLPAASALAFINEAYSVSPPVVLTFLENEYGLLSNPQAVVPADISVQIRGLAAQLSTDFYSHYNGHADGSTMTADGVEVPVYAPNAAGYALAAYHIGQSSAANFAAVSNGQGRPA